MSIEKKKVFIEKNFARERTIIDIMFSGTFAGHFFNSVFEKVYREKRDNMIKGLKGKLTFDEFKSYFASFSVYKWMSLMFSKNMSPTNVSERKKFNF